MIAGSYVEAPIAALEPQLQGVFIKHVAADGLIVLAVEPIQAAQVADIAQKRTDIVPLLDQLPD
jgi:hypothetical protein